MAGGRPKQGAKCQGVQNGHPTGLCLTANNGKEATMKTAILTLPLIAAAGIASAHEGHIAPMGGHSHGEILAVAIAACVALGIYVYGRRA